METLIELYDERAIENVLGPETFKPKRVIYLCAEEVANDQNIHEIYNRFYKKHGLDIEIDFVKSNIYKSDKILRQFEYIYASHPDCCLDVTGGNDATLVAAGMFCQKTGVPTFTYSRKKNQFYDICNAAFANELTCNLSYTVEDFFLMTGGTMRKGRVDNMQLTKYINLFDPMFKVFLKYKNDWVDTITFFTRISQNSKDERIKLSVRGSMEQKGDRGRRVRANKYLLKDLEEIGLLFNLEFKNDNTVSFMFRDEQVRAWLRDVGSALELYMYKACIDADIFGDVISSAIVDWDGMRGHETVSNEIDVVAARGIIPMFISCKACEVKTEALNELAILRDRFGGKGAKAAIVTTEFCTAAARHRAAQLQIAVIDIEELENDNICDRLKTIMKVAH